MMVDLFCNSLNNSYTNIYESVVGQQEYYMYRYEQFSKSFVDVCRELELDKNGNARISLL
jgi:hypothetical protein